MGKPRLFMALFVVALLAVVLAGCQVISEGTIRGSGNVEIETREVGDFARVSVCCGMQLVFTQADETSLAIEAEDNLLPRIDDRMNGDTLVIEFDQSSSTSFSYQATRPVRVIVSGPTIHGFRVSGSGRVEAGNLSTEADFDLELSGGSQGVLQNLSAGTLTAELSGGSSLEMDELRAGQVTLDFSGGSRGQLATLSGDRLAVGLSGNSRLSVAGGEVATQRLDLSGGSEYQAGDLLSDTTEIGAGGQATIWVQRSLQADLSGGSSVEYYGAPSVNEDLSGGSQLVPLGEK